MFAGGMYADEVADADGRWRSLSPLTIGANVGIAWLCADARVVVGTSNVGNCDNCTLRWVVNGALFTNCIVDVRSTSPVRSAKR